MSFTFDRRAKALVVPVTLVGPRQSHEFPCVLDTGATQSVFPARLLRALGYDLSHSVGRTRLRAATGIALAPVIRISAVAALDRVRTDFLVAAHDFPLGTDAEGLLGLDFLSRVGPHAGLRPRSRLP